MSYAMRKRKTWIFYPLSAHAILFGLDLSLGTELISPLFETVVGSMDGGSKFVLIDV